MEQYALQQQIELLQAQQAMLQSQQSGLAVGQQNMLPMSMSQYNYNPQHGIHRRGQSTNQAIAGPPPAPSSGSSGFTEVTHQRRGSQSGHSRRHSLALPEAKRAAEKAQAVKQNTTFAFPSKSSVDTSEVVDSQAKQHDSGNSSRRSGSPLRRSGVGHSRSQSMASRMGSTSPVRGMNFQFPPSQSSTISGSQDSSLGRSSSGGHGRQPSRNFDGNWRAGPPVSQEPQPYFTPGHRPRPSSSSISSLQNFGQNFQYSNHPQFGMLPPPNGMLPSQHLQPQGQNVNSQQRKSLFSPYLPQATLPALLGDGRLVAGILRVNKKNRSDAYVSTDLLDDDIFICGSKDRNRALEGDFVAVELLDVDEVWSAKKDKEDKKKRKDTSTMAGPGLKRQGSIRDRPDAKKKDDVEVEGQGLLLVDEEEVNDEQKPMYAGHIVAVVERTAGQMFSGTLGLLRPSSAATKEKQDAERIQRDGPTAITQGRQVERPKIVWFKPTDKRVPLIAIPTDQAPKDFVENHEDYRNRLFVACIKRWPITSLHPFGTLVEELGTMGDTNVETDALLRDNSFMAEDFSATILDAVAQITEDIDITNEDRKDFRGERVFSIVTEQHNRLTDAFHIRKTSDGYEVGVHISDANFFIPSGYVLDREARKRGCAVHLVQRTVQLLPTALTEGLAAFTVHVDRRAISIVFKISEDFQLEDSWLGKSIIRNTALYSHSDISAIVSENSDHQDSALIEEFKALRSVARSLHELRYPSGSQAIPALDLFHQLDQVNTQPSPESTKLYEAKPAKFIVDELLIRANVTVAELLLEKHAGSALLRKQQKPNWKKMDQFAVRAQRLGVQLVNRNIPEILSSIAVVEDLAVRKALEIYLLKACNTPKYATATYGKLDSLVHYGLNVPIYTHFTRPYERYSDILVHRQVAAALENRALNEEDEALAKSIDLCNTKVDAARSAQDQSVHLMLCSMIQDLSNKQDLVVREAVVINVMESSFDVLIPQFAVEKRVHLDQLPLHKAEFDPKSRKLELFWIRSSESEAWVPVTSTTAKGQSGTIDNQVRPLEALSLEEKPLPRAEIALASQSAPSSPSKHDVQDKQRPASATSDLQLLQELPQTNLKCTTRRQSNGDLVQEVVELAYISVVLQADCMHKSPPLLLVRPLRPHD